MLVKLDVRGGQHGQHFAHPAGHFLAVEAVHDVSVESLRKTLLISPLVLLLGIPCAFRIVFGA